MLDSVLGMKYILWEYTSQWRHLYLLQEAKQSQLSLNVQTLLLRREDFFFPWRGRPQWFLLLSWNLPRRVIVGFSRFCKFLVCIKYTTFLWQIMSTSSIWGWHLYEHIVDVILIIINHDKTVVESSIDISTTTVLYLVMQCNAKCNFNQQSLFFASLLKQDEKRKAIIKPSFLMILLSIFGKDCSLHYTRTVL